MKNKENITIKFKEIIYFTESIYIYIYIILLYGME